MSDPTNALPMPYQPGKVKPSGVCPVCGGCNIVLNKCEGQVQISCWDPECSFSIILEGKSVFDAMELWDRLRVVE